MEPQPMPQPQLFRYTQRLTSIAVEEAAVTLIENDSAFSVLLSELTHAGSRSSEIILDDVTLVRCRNKKWAENQFSQVSIRPNEDGIWIAQETSTNLLFHEPSIVPYHVVLIGADDYARLMEHVKFNRLPAVFAYSQGLFGSLPGFDFHEDGLMVPENYAAAGNRVIDAEYVTEK